MLFSCWLGQADLAGLVLVMPFAHCSFELVSSLLFFCVCLYLLSAILFGLMHDMSDDERLEMQLGHHGVWEREKKEGKKALRERNTYNLSNRESGMAR